MSAFLTTRIEGGVHELSEVGGKSSSKTVYKRAEQIYGKIDGAYCPGQKIIIGREVE